MFQRREIGRFGLDGTGLTVVRQGRRLLLCVDQESFQLWRTGVFRHRLVGRFPRTDDGWQAARAQYDAIDPAGVPAPPGQAYHGRRLTRFSKVALTLGAAVVVLGVLAMSGTFTDSPHGQGLRGWIYGDSTSAIFVQWTRTDNSVQGNVSIADLESAQATSITTQNVSFTGVISGRSVSLTFNGALGSVTTVTGQLEGSNVVLSLPQEDGSLQLVTLRPAATTDYNADVSSLQAAAAANQQAATQASAAAARAAADASKSAAAVAVQAAADQAVDEAGSNLAQALEGANSDAATLTTDLTAMRAADGPLAQEAHDLATTQADAAKVELEARSAPAGDGSVCSDASGVQSDATGVDSDNTGVQSALTGVASDVQTVQQDQAAVAADQQQLAHATQANPRYMPTAPPLPPDAAIAHATTAMSAALKDATTTTQMATTRGNDLAASAHKAADEASRAGGC